MRAITLVLLFATLGPAAAAAYPDCGAFKARMADAEKANHLILPAISFHDESTPAGGAGTDYSMPDIKNFDVELTCTKAGAFDTFQITQTGVDDYSSERFIELSQAALWAYTGWPPARAADAIRKLLIGAAAATEKNRIRGTEFDEGRVSLDLGDNIDATMSGGHSFGLWFTIDASAPGQ